MANRSVCVTGKHYADEGTGMYDLSKLKKPYERIKVLVVDDETSITEMLTERLEMNGYTVFTAGDGREGLDAAINLRPDIILLDIMMPVMDGPQMLEALRQQPQGGNIAVIMVSAVNRAQDISRAEACGVEDYIVKPFELSALMGKIENIVERRRAFTDQRHH